MVVVQCDLNLNLNIPPIQDQTQRCLERNQHPQTDATTSFLNTCFNGLNTLSGIYFSSSHSLYSVYHNLIQFYFSALLSVSHTCMQIWFFVIFFEFTVFLMELNLLHTHIYIYYQNQKFWRFIVSFYQNNEGMNTRMSSWPLSRKTKWLYLCRTGQIILNCSEPLKIELN